MINRILFLANLLLIGTLSFLRLEEKPEDPELTRIIRDIKKQGKKADTALLGALNIKVRAIWTNRCFQCHSSEKRKGMLALDTYEAVLAGGEEGPVLVPGNASKSEMIRRLKLPRSNREAMPKKGQALSPEQVKAIETWIDFGAYWKDSAVQLFYEAPLSLEKPIFPEYDGGHSHPVDRFTASYFKTYKIKWPKSLSDAEFLRKVHLDITGLLPSPDSLAAFLANEDPDKRNHIINRLLADQENYALHWLSFWNDLLRNDYSGTGFITGGRKQISSWLYSSLYEDSSYTRMVKSLVNPHPASEGFIAGIQWRGEVNSSQRVEMQAAQNISQSLLGTNLKCASCHNSFVNNLSLAQSYGFASVFSKLPLEMYRCDVATGTIAEPAFIYPQLGPITADSLPDRLVQLAEVMTSAQNGRLYRTLVNRIWARLMGRGIVGKVDDMDQKPWSQELLDYLAADFVEKGTGLKDLIRLITSSKIYQSRSIDYGSEEEIRNSDFIFRGPAKKRIQAEQMADILSEVIQPVYSGVSFDPGAYHVPAAWIWYPEKEFDRIVLPRPDTVYFRKILNLPAMARAELLVTADDEYELFINGKPVTSGKDYRYFQPVDPGEALIKGKNCIAVKAINKGYLANPAGLLFHMRIHLPDKDTLQIYSDTSWLVSKTVSGESWKQVKYKDRDWVKIHRYGRYSSSHWGMLRHFNFDAKEQPPFSRASLVSADPFLKALGRPTRENVTTARSQEAGLLQAIALQNDPLLHQRVREGSANWVNKYQGKESDMIDRLYLHLLGRIPSAKEKTKLMEYYKGHPGKESVADIIWALLMSPEFQMI
ncbi:MAG TPA: DUF1553 domain-containing protein [Saprospiraceae bacterium]|nr:DUF1553 domain-containing protein [Saprospiraceae bacterium]